MEYKSIKEIKLELEVGDIAEWKNDNEEIVQFVVTVATPTKIKGMVFKDTRADKFAVPHEVLFMDWSLRQYLYKLRKISAYEYKSW